MITLPDFSKAFEYENNFYLSCNKTRISRILAHYELFKRTVGLPGAVVEFGVFKGTSLIRFIMFRDILGNSFSRKIIGFDTFSRYPNVVHELDKEHMKDFINKAGWESISKDQLIQVLNSAGVSENIELVEGDICETAPKFIKDNECLKVSLINLDTNFYLPTKVALEYFWPRLTKGGILLLDDYGIVYGETEAVDEYFADKNVKIEKLPFSMKPFFIVKN